MPSREPGMIAKGPERSHMRAFRSESREDMLRRQLMFLGAALPGQQKRLLRALRLQRQAAASGRSYDLARHFALARLCRSGTLRPSGQALTSGRENSTGAAPCPIRQTNPKS